MPPQPIIHYSVFTYPNNILPRVNQIPKHEPIVVVISISTKHCSPLQAHYYNGQKPRLLVPLCRTPSHFQTHSAKYPKYPPSEQQKSTNHAISSAHPITKSVHFRPIPSKQTETPAPVAFQQLLVAAMAAFAVSSSAAILVVLLHLISSASALTTDGLALLALKSAISADPTAALSSWSDADADPCGWLGVTCRAGRITDLSLPNLSLAGYLPSELSLLSELQTLSLPHNLLSGPLPTAIGDLISLATLDISFNNLSSPIPAAIGRLRNLATLDLSHNSLYGEIPTSIGSMDALSRLDLSSNIISGTIPSAIAALHQLSGVLNLSSNLLTGPIPPEFGAIPVTVSLDLRLNNLSGEIPPVGSLLNQGPTAFAGNPNLCGFPLKTPCAVAQQDPSIPQTDPGINPNAPINVPAARKKAAAPAAVPILAGVVLVAVVSVLLLQWQLRRRRGAAEGKTKAEEVAPVATEWREGRSGEIYVALDEGFGLELEELLRASAYVVGKSRSGIVYKVVVARGNAVAVRRLSEAEEGECEDDWRRRRAFEAEAAAIGRAKHQNVVALRAYYYAPDEKLLVYDYIAGGTLHAALHGGQSNPAAPPLLWAARLAIVQGAARGLAYIHECSPRKYTHGNFKSSKILLDEELRPYISGFGLNRIISGANKFSHSTSKKLSSGPVPTVDQRNPLAAGYLAPEARAPGSTVTQKCDVYAFGIVLLEMLTGQTNGGDGELEGSVRRAFKEERPLFEVVDAALLHEVHAKKEVLAVFHVALGCTEADPEARPRMKAVSESLDRLGAGH